MKLGGLSVNDMWKILIVDDEESVHAMTKLVSKKLVFENKNVKFYSAYSEEEAKNLLKEHNDIAVVLLDVVMEHRDSGFRLVRFIREELKNKELRIIIRTGQPGTAPEKEVVLKYDINDYREKTDLSYQKLITGLLMSIRNYKDLMALKNSKGETLRAKEEAHKANQVKVQFLANMSHEIRTPMNGIMGITQLLEYTELTQQQEEYVKLLKDSAERLMHTINDILDLSKIESGTIVLKKNPFGVKKLYEEIVNKYQYEFEKKGIEFNYEMDPLMPEYVLGDRDKIYQIISILLDNSIKFTPKGYVRFCMKREKTNYIKIEVEDSGIGMTHQAKDRIFDIFTQEDESNTRKFGGSGLGLAIAKSYVDLMDGEIDVVSELGEGSFFSAIIRILYLEEGKQDLDINNAMSILLVEDDLINQQVISSLLERVSDNVDIAMDGEKALTMTKNKKYDFIFMDISIPIIDGIALTKMIRKMPDYKGIPIVALTAHSHSNIKKMCLDSGMNDYLSKPVKADELYQKIDEFSIDNL